jgi:hypothetical protein
MPTTKRLLASCFAAMTLGALAFPAFAQAPAPAMKKFSGVWIEGPGFDITYGGNYDGCAQRCLANPTCQMIEYYRPEKKCNLYKEVLPQKPGGSSDVAIRR